MNYNIVSFELNFGQNILEVQCPECNHVYHIPESEMQFDKVKCWHSWLEGNEIKRCEASYYQKYQQTHELQFVRKFIHRCKGEK